MSTDDKPTTAAVRAASPWRVGALLFGSGFAALVYQVAWTRELRLVFGASTAATAAVLAVFIGGLGIGGLLFGHRADRARRPLALYGALELGAAALAALSPLLLSLVRMYGGATSRFFASASVRKCGKPCWRKTPKTPTTHTVEQRRPQRSLMRCWR